MTPPHHQATGQPDYRLAELPRRYVRPIDLTPDQLARLFDGQPHAEPEIVRLARQREKRAPLWVAFVGTAVASLVLWALLVGAMVLL